MIMVFADNDISKISGMKPLKSVDPIKHLKGKLNFLRAKNPAILSVLKLVNSLKIVKQNGTSSESQDSIKQSSLSKITVEEIKQLASSSTISDYDHKKMIFQSHIHKHANPNTQTGTIYEQLDKHQKRLILTLLKYSDQLNVRQISYLQYSLRRKINALYPSWQNIHFVPQSPLRKQFAQMPTITSMQHLHHLQLLPRKTLVDLVSDTRPKVEKKEPPPQKTQSPPPPPPEQKVKVKGKGRKDN